MEFNSKPNPKLRVDTRWTSFAGEGTHEYHIILTPTDLEATFSQQIEALHEALNNNISDNLQNARLVMRRYFISDAANQLDTLQQHLATQPQCATSIVQQPPLCGAKVAIWAYLATDMHVVESNNNNTIALQHGQHTHYWTATNYTPDGDAENQTVTLLQNYEETLLQKQINIADNCVRTWFFVRDVDVNYGGVVEGRKNNFLSVGLTSDTHYISSTGIEGRYANGNIKVLMDAYAISNLKPGQMTYLYAPTHLNPTYEYGVTFERGTCIEYADRKHIFISGTASIDNRGNVLHIGDITQQVDRMLENISALLAERSANFSNIAQMIIYLRDTADYNTVNQIFQQRYPLTPKIIVLAPVCRPTWLIEMECIAICNNQNKTLAPY